MYAKDSHGARVAPARDTVCHCPLCGNVVRAKALTSKLVTPHWAHIASDCDSWSEPESAWHRAWKERFPEECREVVMGPHRADVRLADGLVIEIQHSFLPESEILERENFYGRMVWVVDARAWDIGHRDRYAVGSDTYGDEEYTRYQVDFTPLRDQKLTAGQLVKFRWRRPRRTWAAARRQLFLDVGNHLVKVGKMHWDEFVGGWGTVVDAANGASA